MNNQTNSATPKSNRVESLDAFRGVASFLIMVTHFILCVPEVCQAENLGCIYGGLSWKLPYFFVLSGFVLTLSYERSKATLSHPFRSFLVSRVLRIYPLFFITTIVMYLLRMWFEAGTPIDGASIFFNISWKLSDTFPNLLYALTLIGFENAWLYNGPAWTLVFEMRYALIFPLLLWVMRRSYFTILLFVGAAFVASNVSATLDWVDLFYCNDDFISKMCSMAIFLLYYVGGILLALHRERLSQLYSSLSHLGRTLFFAVMLVAVLNPLWVKSLLPSVVSSMVGDCLMLLGVAMWIITLLNNKTAIAIFSNNILVAIGRSSFSIYMWHMPIITALYMLLHDYINVWYIIALSIALSLIVAQLSFRYIERPTIDFSRRLRSKA